MNIEDFIKQEEKLKWIADNEYDLISFLKRNGFKAFVSHAGFSKLLVQFPIIATSIMPVGELSYEAKEERLYSLMISDTNRGLFKRICTKKILTNDDIEKVFNNISEEGNARKNKFKDDLVSLGVTSIKSDESLVCPENKEYGANLEWFISQLLYREFSYISDWQVKIEGAPDGGDYDVLAYNGDKLIYIECKGKPPKNITKDELISFLKRDYYLRPYLTILLVDTDDDMKVLVDQCDDMIGEVNFIMRQQLDIKRKFGQSFFEKSNFNIYHFCNRLFVLNSNGNLLEKIRFCFRERFRLGVEETPSNGLFWIHKIFWKDGEDVL